MNIALTIISVLLMLTALVTTVRPRIWAPAAAYAALGLMSLAAEAAVSSPTLIFWGIATLIACGISYMLPTEVSRSPLGMPYITIASVAGTLIGRRALRCCGLRPDPAGKSARLSVGSLLQLCLCQGAARHGYLLYVWSGRNCHTDFVWQVETIHY